MTPQQRPKAYSYTRFSRPEQEDGDSLRRQIAAAREYAARETLDLDETLTFHDPGISAFRGMNAEAGRLGDFLSAVRGGIIPQGSYLLVESLDRISRQTARKAVRTIEDIVEAGINLVDLSDGAKVYNTSTLDKDGGFSFTMMVLRFVRAHEESAMKSRRLLAVYENKRAKAKRKDGGAPFTRMLPAWLRWNAQTQAHEVIPERERVLFSIFEKADEGWGQHRIAEWLNKQRIDTWGGDHGEKRRKAEVWHRSYVKKLLSNSAVVGTFTPHQKREGANGKRKRQPLEPIEGYFPAVIDRELFERVASRIGAPAARGRNATAEPASIFAGVLRCAHCGGLVTRVSKGKYVYLVCSKANRKGTGACLYQAVAYKDVEQAFRRNARAIIKDAPRGQETEELEAEIARLEDAASVIADEARELADELIRQKSRVLRQRLDEKEKELDSARERIRELRAKRKTLAAPYVLHRLRALRDALRSKPFAVADVNKVLKEAVGKIILDPEAGRLTIYWHHAPENPTSDVPFYSRHSRAFDDAGGAEA
jgi:DNA invertase Pin-like site-specific DNA recombinase